MWKARQLMRTPLSGVTSARFYAEKPVKVFEKDLIVIGGGSGGLACAKEAADLGMEVTVLDWVTPSPHGTKWELGGTCVNVGCIPKKLMHQAALLGHSIEHSQCYGWQVKEKPSHSWETMAKAVQSYIRSLNWGYRVQLNERHVQFMNARGSFIDENTVMAVNRHGRSTILKAEHIVIAVGGRPQFPGVPGEELCISSDDIFWKESSPGKTLVIGASYVGLECAGFIHGLGLETDVMIRSIPLRGFDQQIAEMIVENMAHHGVNMLRESVPVRFDRVEGSERVKATWKNVKTNEQSSQEYDTVLVATGRRADTADLKLENAGVEFDAKDGKIRTDKYDRTEKVRHIYAIGDVAKDRPELTPVASKAGKLLAKRLTDTSHQRMCYDCIATAVYTPLEYGSVGLSEEAAIKEHGKDNVEVYHSMYKPLEYNIPCVNSDQCYIKVVCDLKGRIRGIHFLGPNAGEIIQGFAVAMKIGVTYEQLSNTIGIHPTCAEELVKINITKRSGKDASVSGC